MIDSGIWPEHPSFADTAPHRRSAPRAGRGLVRVRLSTATPATSTRLHVQQQAASAPRGDGELQGEVRRRSTPTSSTRRATTRATARHVASTAGGNAGVQSQLFGVDYGKVSGIAPSAQIVAYKAAGHRGRVDQRPHRGDRPGDRRRRRRHQLVDRRLVHQPAPAPTTRVLLRPREAGDPRRHVGRQRRTRGRGRSVARRRCRGSPRSGPPPRARVPGHHHPRPRVASAGARTAAGSALVGSSVTSGTKGAVGHRQRHGGRRRAVPAGQLDPAKVTGKVVLCLVARAPARRRAAARSTRAPRSSAPAVSG